MDTRVDVPFDVPDSAVAALLARIDSVLDNGLGPFLTARAGSAYCLRSLRTTGALISVVVRGCKRIHHGDRMIEIRPGRAVAIAPGVCIDVENIPDPTSGEYLAALHVLSEEVVTMARTLLGGKAAGTTRPARDAPCQLIELSEVSDELAACADAAHGQVMPRFQHALLGLLLRLHECGVDACLAQPQPRLADKISLLLHGSPNREWRSVDIEEHFAISGATLRRQLSAEGTSLRVLLTEARLGQALLLLQSTRLPVKTVAARAGYRSVSSFVRRFQARYGVEPSQVANAG